MPLDVDDISALYTRHATPLVGFFVRRTFDAEVAAELMAETFAQAMTSRRSFRGDGSDEDLVAGWLYGIARNQLGMWLRHAKVERRALNQLGLEPPQLTDAEIERVEVLAGSAELRAEVAARLAELHDDHRDAVRLRVVDELGYEEIAVRLGVSQQVVRARVSRGLRALARALEGRHA